MGNESDAATQVLYGPQTLGSSQGLRLPRHPTFRFPRSVRREQTPAASNFDAAGVSVMGWGVSGPDGVAGVELVVPALLGDQLVVAAPLDDPALFQDHDAVGVLDGGEPVGDDEGGPPGHQGVHARLDQGLGPGVDGAGGLVQDQHRRVGHRRPGDGQQLPLALAEVGAVAGEQGVVAVGQTADEVVGVGQPGCVFFPL